MWVTTQWANNEECSKQDMVISNSKIVTKSKLDFIKCVVENHKFKAPHLKISIIDSSPINESRAPRLTSVVVSCSVLRKLPPKIALNPKITNSYLRKVFNQRVTWCLDSFTGWSSQKIHTFKIINVSKNQTVIHLNSW